LLKNLQCSTWMDKYNYLIEMGNTLDVYDEKNKVEENLIAGCQSRVWLYAEKKDDKVVFSADSDAVITKGIIYLLIRVFSGHTPEEIINADMDFVDQIGLKEHLSPTRSNGLVSMMKQVKMYAVAYQNK